MEQSDDSEDKVPSAIASSSSEHESKSKDQRNILEDDIGNLTSDQHSPSNRSEFESDYEPSQSDRSKDDVINFKSDKRISSKRPNLESDCESTQSDRSKDYFINFQSDQQIPSEGPAQSIHPEHPETQTEDFSSRFVQQHQTQLDSIFMSLEAHVLNFVKNELKRIQEVLNPDYAESFGSRMEDEGLLGHKDEEQKRKSREAVMRIILNFSRGSNQPNLANRLQSQLFRASCKRRLKSSLKKKYRSVFEGIPTAGNPTPLNQFYTELYIIEGGTGEINEEHEVRHIETASRKPHRPETTIRQEDIFQPLARRNEPIKTVMTKGVAGIGKTVLTQKFTLDWAEEKTNHDIQLMFPITFRELNVLKDQKFSLVELVHQFFAETKKINIFEEFQVVFIFDGLDECRLPLDFHNKEIVTDVTESTSVDVLSTNLIRGKLLPSARLWITTRPAAASQIPSDCVSMMTEVRGFTNPQKEEYFKKRFRHEELHSRIISHVKASHSIHIMCHIPVFCWITATVLENMSKTMTQTESPNTLTQMYIHFLAVQTKVKQLKFDDGAKTDSHWNQECSEMIESSSKSAFKQSMKKNSIFYESDLRECDIDIRSASVYSGVFTQIFIEDRGSYSDKVFCFVHSTVQEFSAALHVHSTFINSGVNSMEEKRKNIKTLSLRKQKPRGSHECAVEKALQSENGHLDLFLRFLSGLSVETNQVFLRGLSSQMTHINTPITDETVLFIKKKVKEDLSVEKSINLFHCLNELKDHSLVREIQQSLSSGTLSTDKLTTAQWSASVFILSSSDKYSDVFDSKKFSASEDVLRKSSPVVKASSKALSRGCNLSEISCENMYPISCSESCCSKELDSSDNNSCDSGVKELSNGSRSPKCNSEILRSSGCSITEEGCASLALASSSDYSHSKVSDSAYNNPGVSGVKLSLACQSSTLETLRLEPAGEKWLKPGSRKYSHQSVFNTNSMNRLLKLTEKNKKVIRVDKVQHYDRHPDRFDGPQSSCTDGSSGRCYWEVEWRGEVNISVSYKGIRRREPNDESLFGRNNQSWSLHCSSHSGYAVWHNNSQISIMSSISKIVASYLDCPAGISSFYKVSSGKSIHLHTFATSFKEKLYPGFGLWSDSSSVSLC